MQEASKALFEKLGIGPVWVERRDAPEERAGKDPGVATPARVQAAPKDPSPARASKTIPIADASKLSQASWEELQAMVEHCEACPELTANRTMTVFGARAEKTRVLLIGEAPGREEDLQGEPFVGASGRLLENILAALDLKRGCEVSIINVLKCRPPENRDPLPAEKAACLPFLKRQIALLAPERIVCMGKPAMSVVLGYEGAVSGMRGKRHASELAPGVPVFVTYHPSYLLRSPQEKAAAWRDFLYALQA